MNILYVNKQSLCPEVNWGYCSSSILGQFSNKRHIWIPVVSYENQTQFTVDTHQDQQDTISDFDSESKIDVF